MKKRYIVHIVETSRGINDEESEMSIFNCEERAFKTKEEGEDFIIERYKYLDKVDVEDMYRDVKDNNTIIVGKIVQYNNKDYSHNGEEWYQEDWVSFIEETYDQKELTFNINENKKELSTNAPYFNVKTGDKL